jgi:hypothetical protein
MAPINPKYSQQVTEVRDCILNIISEQQTSFLNTADVLTRIKDIWKGMLCEDFVFSFRNTIELRAYYELESEYKSKMGKLVDMVHGFIDENARKEMEMCTSADDLRNVEENLVEKISKMISEKVAELTKELKKFIKRSDHKERLIQWQESKLLGLKNEGEKQCEKSKKYFSEMKENRNLKIIRNHESDNHKNDFRFEASVLADKIKDDNLSDE